MPEREKLLEYLKEIQVASRAMSRLLEKTASTSFMSEHYRDGKPTLSWVKPECRRCPTDYSTKEEK